AYLFMSRTFDGNAFPAQYFSTISPGIVGGVTWHVSRDFGVILRGRVHYLLYNVDENRSLGFWELATAVSYAL
ncbi:MAG TPA: caspase family protein, partial [Polyangia bacterium]|nr:caspase family protein [Polyangia bacterium]